jgi:phospholipid/cholesterol/gamma-HCH transport system ATP-binding protein
VRRRQERVARMLHTFDPATAEAIRASLPADLLSLADAGVYEPTTEPSTGRHWRVEPGAEIAASSAGVPGPRGER